MNVEIERRWTRANPDGMTMFELRECLGWPAFLLADRLGTTMRAVSRMEAGMSETHPKVLAWMRDQLRAMRDNPMPDNWDDYVPVIDRKLDQR